MHFERNKLIRFHHCDPAGIVFYPQYLVLCNELVEDWFRDGLGVDFWTLHHEHRLGVPMAHLECDYLAPSAHNDELTFRLEVARLGNASMTLDVVAAKDGNARFRAKLTMVLASMDTLRPVRIEGEWRQRFERFAVQANVATQEER